VRQRKLDNFLIRCMQEEDLAFAAQCTANEGWQSEDFTSLMIFYNYDPHGCFIAEQNGQKVGICIATKYAKSGFIGELIVLPEARGRGIGVALLNHGVAYLQQGGANSIYLDGVVKAVNLYERNGFRKVCRSWRFSGRLGRRPGENVRQMTTHDLPQVFALDFAQFGTDRNFFLQHRFKIFPNLSYVMVVDDRITGFILGRCGEGWISAGPWVVEKDADNALDLLYAFVNQAGDLPINLGILDCNQKACEQMNLLGFIQHEDSPWRMVLGKQASLGASVGCFAIGSAAKG
jgi:GNAT superfamily N-acetyltransferase